MVALGCLMDEISYFLRHEGIPTSRRFAEHLRSIATICRWTHGVWNFSVDDQRRWNELQNTPRDIKVLSDHLLREYRLRRVDAVSAAA
jgi:hypothetical protein